MCLPLFSPCSLALSQAHARLVTSGIFPAPPHSPSDTTTPIPDEAAIWVALLPSMPLSTTAAVTVSRSASTQLSQPAAASEATPAVPSQAVHVMLFFTEAVVTLSRRPHEAHDLLQEALLQGERLVCIS